MKYIKPTHNETIRAIEDKHKRSANKSMASILKLFFMFDILIIIIFILARG